MRFHRAQSFFERSAEEVLSVPALPREAGRRDEAPGASVHAADELPDPPERRLAHSRPAAPAGLPTKEVAAARLRYSGSECHRDPLTGAARHRLRNRQPL